MAKELKKMRKMSFTEKRSTQMERFLSVNMALTSSYF